MLTERRIFELVAVAVVAAGLTCIPPTASGAEPDNPTRVASVQLDAAAQRFIGTWTMITPRWGRWQVVFGKATQQGDGKVLLNMVEMYDVSKPTERSVEVLDDGSLVIPYSRPNCKGMADVTDGGLHLMKLTVINGAGTRLHGTMMSRDCLIREQVQLVRD